MDHGNLLAGRYRLVERLGAGGMSVVWRGHDEALGRQVAVKILSGVYAADPASQELIRAEAQVMAALSDPNLPRVYDYGEQLQPDGARMPFLVMEVVPGPTLSDLLRQGPLPWPTAVDVCAQLAAALAAAHARGLVHRDVKPANVMLTPTGVKLVDFGLAAAAGAGCEHSPDGLVLGTPAYLAPERLTATAVTPASDVYALGLVLYRALTGALPWTAATVTQMIQAHRYTEPASMPAVPGLPRSVRRLCARCLSKAPTKRPTSADAARLLRAAALGATTPAPRARLFTIAAGSSRMRRATVAPAAAAVLAGGLLTASQPDWIGFAGRVATAAGPPIYDTGPTRCAAPNGTQLALDATPCAEADGAPPVRTTATDRTGPDRTHVEPSPRPPATPAAQRADAAPARGNGKAAGKTKTKTKDKKNGKGKGKGKNR